MYPEPHLKLLVHMLDEGTAKRIVHSRPQRSAPRSRQVHEECYLWYPQDRRFPFLLSPPLQSATWMKIYLEYEASAASASHARLPIIGGGIASVGLVAAQNSPDGVVGGECANVPGNYPTTLLYSLGRRLDASWL